MIFLSKREANLSKGAKAVCHRADEKSVVTVIQCGLARLAKPRCPRDLLSQRQFFFLLSETLPFWEKCAEDPQHTDETRECVHVFIIQQSAFCGANHNPCCFEDRLLFLLKDEYIIWLTIECVIFSINDG